MPVAQVHPHVLLQQVQPVEVVSAEEAGVGLVVGVHLHVAVQRAAVQKALVADVAGQGADPLPPVAVQVLLQLLLVPERLPTLEALEGPERLADEEVLQSCVLKTRAEKKQKTRSGRQEALEIRPVSYQLADARSRLKASQ